MTGQRDPQRIEPLIEALRRAWEASPDQRLGQLVYNAARTVRDVPPCPALFYLEDGLMLDGLRQMAPTEDPR